MLKSLCLDVVVNSLFAAKGTGMIVGLGNDIVSIERIAGVLNKFGQHFMRRVFTSEEVAALETVNSAAKMAASAAKIFAAKEACAKALGTGFRYGLEWQDITILHDEHGRPIITLRGKGLEFLNKIGGRKIWLTLSDDFPWANAVVVIES